MAKKRVGFITSNPLYKTGFSTNAKVLLNLLYKLDKFDLYLLAQGVSNDDPEIHRMPYHVTGTIKRGVFNEDLYGRDPGYQRLTQYGNLTVESWIIENKLDVVIHIEDIWSSDVSHYLDNKTWWPHFKNNFLNWVTVDSLPLLDTVKRWAAECPNFWVWASFAEKELKRIDAEKYKNVKTVFGALNPDEYYPISLLKKRELRDKFKIDQDDVIFIQLGRNQLRKLFPCSIEAFSNFKRRNPDKKAKLLFHCSWSEPGGWPFEKLIKDFGLEKNDVLTSYFCRACGQYEVKPFSGEEQDCPYCKAPKAQLTAGVGSSITNRELSEIYGICDASLSIFTSGGLEYHSVQQFFCALPSLISNYSCGEDFINVPGAFELSGSHTFESGTGFIKHVPNLNLIEKFFKTICEMKPKDRRELGMRGREWVLKYFNPNNTIKLLEEFIDSREPISWNYEIEKPEKKCPECSGDSTEDDLLWVKSLYVNILKMTMTDDDSGVVFWLGKLKQGEKRENIENYFKKIGLEENSKTHPLNLEDLLDSSDSKRGIIVCPESLGDVFILTSLFEDFHNNYPDHRLYFCCKPEFACILEGNPYIHRILPYAPMMESELALTGCGNNQGLFNVAFFPFIHTQRILSYLSPDKIGLEL